MKHDIYRIEGLCIEFQRWGETVAAIADLNLTIHQGEWVMLIGHNGSGKSTLLRVLAGQLAPTRGTVCFKGRALDGIDCMQTACPTAFLVEQNPLASASAKLTLLENLQVADEDSTKLPRKERTNKYEEMLASVGLARQMNQLARYLSGGERQLLSLLIAQLRPSPVLLLDEPLAALDPTKEQLCMELIAGLNRAGRTVIHVTHDHELAFSIGSRVIELERGYLKSDASNPKYSNDGEGVSL